MKEVCRFSNFLNNTTNKMNQANRMEEHKKGIKPEDAISILFERSKVSNSAKNEMKPELKNLGQTLDLLSSQNIPNDNDQEPNHEKESAPSNSSQSSPITNTTPQNENPKNESNKFKQELLGQPPSKLLQRLFQIQQERVSTYAEFNGGLETVLQSGNLTDYPHLTVTITAKFSVLSKSIRDIQGLLLTIDTGVDAGGVDTTLNNTNPDLQSANKFVSRLQELEKEKLNLTAALHLDQMRERNESLGLELDQGGNARIAELLKESVKSIQSKVGDCIEKINEVLEELRYIAADLE